MAEAARSAGYTGAASLNGRTANQAFADGKAAAIWAFFGHSDAGILSTYDAAYNADDQYMIAGKQTDVVPLYVNTRGWSEYLPVADVDDIRLAIAAGCYTARSDAGYGSFPEAGTRLGMDSVVTFNDLVYFPAWCPNCVTSGNYFWDRAAAHLESGTSISTALARARTDLVAREGNDKGWGSYRIAGAAANPGAVKLRPAGPGDSSLDLPAAGIQPYRLSSLHRSGTSAAPTGHSIISTEEGVELRLDQDGHLVDVWAPATVTGPVTISKDDVAGIATTFLEQLPDTAALLADDPTVRATRHVAGEELFEVRFATTGIERPAQAVVEIDRRTGAVVYGTVTRPEHETTQTQTTVSEAEAVAIARASLSEQTSLVRAHPDPWSPAHWVVHLRGREPDGMPNFLRVTIDETGEVSHVERA